MSESCLVIFDVDGTLVDSQHMIVSALASAFAGEGLAAPDRTTMLSVVGLSLTQAMCQLAGGDAARHKRMADTYKQAFSELRQQPDYHEPLFPGAMEVLDALSACDDMLLGIATGKSRRGVDNVLALHGLRGRFHTVQTADTHPSKPHPSMVRQALDETGVAAARAIVVGDTVFDMEMARAGGVGAIGVSWGYHEADALAPAGAQAVIGDFSELPPLVEAMFLPVREVAS